MAVFVPLLVLGTAGLARWMDREVNRRKNKQYVSPRGNRTNTLGGNPAKGLENRRRFGGKTGNVFAYPVDIDVNQDHIQISQYKYKRPGVGSGAREAAWNRANASAPGASTKGMKFEGTIVLPMPKVSDSNAANWGKSEMDVMELMKLQAAGVGLGAGQRGLDERQEESMMRSGSGEGLAGSKFGGGQATRGQKGEYFYQNLPLPFLAKRTADAIGGNVTDDVALGRTRGQIMNPNAELLFQGTNLREFGFKWQMVARSSREGDMIRRIIRKFKIGAAPKFNNTALMEFPDIWHIKYMKGRNELMTANRFEQLALTSISVDYAPDGTWTAYDDSQPISIRMELNFKELRPIWRSHHEKFSPEMSVGY